VCGYGAKVLYGVANPCWLSHLCKYCICWWGDNRIVTKAFGSLCTAYYIIHRGLHYLVKVKTKNVILQWDVAKENCIRCMYHGFIKVDQVIMCLKFTYLGCYTAMLIWNKDWWPQRPARMLDANLFWLWLGHHRCYDWQLAWPSKVVCVLVIDTLNTRCDMNVHLYHSPERFLKLNVIWCM